MAFRLRVPLDDFMALLAGDRELTVAIAAQLEQELEIPAQLWNGLEAKYRSELAREAEWIATDGAVRSA